MSSPQNAAVGYHPRDDIEYNKLEDNDSSLALPRKPVTVQSAQNDDAMNFNDILKLVGSGWLVAATYIDPGNLEGDLNAGRVREESDGFSGYSLLWVLVWSSIMGSVFQKIAIRLGCVCDQDMASLCQREYPRVISICIWVCLEICLIGADMQSVIGFSTAVSLIAGIPIGFGIAISILDAIISPLWISSFPRLLSISSSLLIWGMVTSFFTNVIVDPPYITPVLEGLLLIKLTRNSFNVAINLLGSVLMPHSLFLQSFIIRERMAKHGTSIRSRSKVLRVFETECYTLTLASLIINVCVVVVFANPSIALDKKTLTLADAHLALESTFGPISAAIWSFGLLAAGHCAAVSGTYAGQHIMEGILGYKIGISWLRTVVARVIAVVPLLLLLQYPDATVEDVSNKINLLQACFLPFTLSILLKFASSKRICQNSEIPKKTLCAAYVAGTIIFMTNAIFLYTAVSHSSYRAIISLLAYVCVPVGMWFCPLKSDRVT